MGQIVNVSLLDAENEEREMESSFKIILCI